MTENERTYTSMLLKVSVENRRFLKKIAAEKGVYVYQYLNDLLEKQQA